MFKVESGVKMPSRPSMRGVGAKYPFFEMEVGDSFIVEDLSARIRVSSAASQCGARNNMKFSVRKDGDVLRVFRTA